MSGSRLTTVLLILFAGGIFAIAILAQDRTQIPVLTGIALVSTGLLVGLYRQRDLTLWSVVVLAVVFRLALAWTPPSLSDDAYRYVWDGIVQAEGINPYRFKPEDAALQSLHDEPVYELLNSPAYFSVYPPVSQYVFAAGSVFYGGGWGASHFAIKGILLLAEIAAMLLLARLVSIRALLLYAWNPLVLLETAGQGHTESLLLLLLVLVIVAHKAQRGRWAGVALAAATWVKLFPVFLFPFLWRRYGWRAAWPGAAALVLLAVPYAAPYVAGNVLESLDLYRRFFEFNAGLYYGIKQVFYFLTGTDYSKQLGPALQWCFFAGLPVLYALDRWRKWTLAQAFFVAILLYLLLTTTVHPWYLLSVLLLGSLLAKPVWPVIWLGAWSIGTYMLYVGGPYWTFVAVGWGGALVIGVVQYRRDALDAVLRLRARSKYWFIQPVLPRLTKPLTVLDLGCGEGFVGERIASAAHAEVYLTDIVDMNRTTLRHVVCKPGEVPLPDKSFDVVVLYWVLHHCEDANAVLMEAKRVARQRVIVVESVYRTPLQLAVLTVVDTAANRVRSWEHMSAQEEHLHFRKAEEWRALFEDMGFKILAEHQRGRLIHLQHLFVLK